MMGKSVTTAMSRLDNFIIHHWENYDNGGAVDKRRCRICGQIDWFNFFTLEWFTPWW
jgi:hypothetical protein